MNVFISYFIVGLEKYFKRKRYFRYSYYSITITITHCNYNCNPFLSVHLDSEYDELLIQVFGTTNPTYIQTPFFGSSSTDFSCLNLSEGQMIDMTKVLYLIAHNYPHLEFIPIFPSIAAILFTLYPSRVVLSLLEALIRAGSSHADSKDWPFFPQNRRENLLFGRIFEDLLLKHIPNVSRHVLKLQKDEPEFNPKWNRLLSEFFVGILPNSYIFKIFDAYIIEGYKTPLRFALAHIALLQQDLLQTKSGAEFSKVLFQVFDSSVHEGYYSFKLLQKTAYSLKFSRNILIRFKNRHRKLSLEDFEDEDRAIILQRPLPKISRASSFLTDQDWANVWTWIPARFKILDLDLVFTSADHGHRLATLFERAEDNDPLLIFIETTDGNIFGSYLSKSLKNRSSRRFFGTGETFIFNLRPSPQSFPWQESFENYQFIYADENFLAIGCSGGKFGIWIDRDLNQVVSSPCDTFKNPSFIDHESGWSDIYCIEVYKFK